MNRYATIQDQFCSSYDKRKLCSFDIEFVDRPTKPLLHQTSRFLYFLKGKGTIKIDGISYPVVPDTFIAILPWETTVIDEVKEPMQFMKIVYNSDFITQSMKSSYNTSNELFSVLTPIGNTPVVYCTPDEAKIIKNIMNEIKNETGVESIYDVQEEKELSKVYVTNKLCELLIHFKRFITKKECVQMDGSSIELDQRNAIFKYMYSHLNEKQTLTKISAMFFMSESAISKYIMDVTGLSFTELLNEMRIVKAMDLLTYTDLTLNEIASITGFTDASHISKVFNERVGTTPKTYQNIYRNLHEIFGEKEKSVSYEIITYIYENYMEDLKIQNVADKFHISVIELNRILLFQLEKNFEDLIHFLRINKACEMLLTTDAAITDIGFQVGYNTVKTFNRNFVKLKNMSPGNFRKTILFQKGSETILVENLHQEKE
ncbi:AraC family transcriptional regulator [Traorella massiliensis]|uniref:AraC family transcriptional regulator n=1 Tax=Traorella massiliensis TaxID=1903263 RepID=UPI0008F7FFD2|nr:AraC family transcriptional regulator [Traorella massiliensis]